MGGAGGAYCGPCSSKNGFEDVAASRPCATLGCPETAPVGAAAGRYCIDCKNARLKTQSEQKRQKRMEGAT